MQTKNEMLGEGWWLAMIGVRDVDHPISVEKLSFPEPYQRLPPPADVQFIDPGASTEHQRSLGLA